MFMEIIYVKLQREKRYISLVSNNSEDTFGHALVSDHVSQMSISFHYLFLIPERISKSCIIHIFHIYT